MSINPNYNYAIYKKVAELYISDKFSIINACAKIGITKQAYYKICKKLGYQSVSSMKDARVNFIDNEDEDITDNDEKETTTEN